MSTREITIAGVTLQLPAINLRLGVKHLAKGSIVVEAMQIIARGDDGGPLTGEQITAVASLIGDDLTRVPGQESYGPEWVLDNACSYDIGVAMALLGAMSRHQDAPGPHMPSP